MVVLLSVLIIGIYLTLIGIIEGVGDFRGDFFPIIDPNRSLFFNLSYEKVISHANIMNYDYVADSLSFSFSKSFNLN